MQLEDTRILSDDLIREVSFLHPIHTTARACIFFLSDSHRQTFFRVARCHAQQHFALVMQYIVFLQGGSNLSSGQTLSVPTWYPDNSLRDNATQAFNFGNQGCEHRGACA